MMYSEKLYKNIRLKICEHLTIGYMFFSFLNRCHKAKIIQLCKMTLYTVSLRFTFT